MLLYTEKKDISVKLWIKLCDKVKLTNYFFCSSAIRQAIAKSLVAYYQKCEYNAYADHCFIWYGIPKTAAYKPSSYRPIYL